MTLVPPNQPKPPHFLYFAPPFIASQRVNLETSIWYIDSPQQVPPCRWKIFPERDVARVSWPVLEFYTPCKISATANARDFKFVRESAMRSLSLVVSECSLSGPGQSHVSNFYIVDLVKFRHSKSSVYRWYPQLVRGRFVYDTYTATKAISSWLIAHVYYTLPYCNTLTS